LKNDNTEYDDCVGRGDMIDITNAKNHLYDVSNFTRPVDMVRFFKIMNGMNNMSNLYENGIVVTTREYFDDSLLEFIVSREDVTLDTI
jgi:hypothetical protein